MKNRKSKTSDTFKHLRLGLSLEIELAKDEGGKHRMYVLWKQTFSLGSCCCSKFLAWFPPIRYFVLQLRPYCISGLKSQAAELWFSFVCFFSVCLFDLKSTWVNQFVSLGNRLRYRQKNTVFASIGLGIEDGPFVLPWLWPNALRNKYVWFVKYLWWYL